MFFLYWIKKYIINSHEVYIIKKITPGKSDFFNRDIILCFLPIPSLSIG